mgnify:CR=1 FL=1
MLINQSLFLNHISIRWLPLFKIILNKVRVILADSNDLVRVGLRTVLNSYKNIDIVGEARDGEELLEQIRSFGSAVVVIDYTAPGFEIDIIPRVLQLNKDVRILAITPEQSAQTLVDALRSGVTSYVKKDCDLSEIQNAVDETGRGNKFFCGQILETIQEANLNIDDIEDVFTCEEIL